MLIGLRVNRGGSGWEVGVLLTLPVGLRRQRRVVLLRHAGTGRRFVKVGFEFTLGPGILLRVVLPGNEHWERCLRVAAWMAASNSSCRLCTHTRRMVETGLQLTFHDDKRWFEINERVRVAGW